MKCSRCGENHFAKRERNIRGNTHVEEYCLNCDKHIRFVPQPLSDFTMPFGKYIGHNLFEAIRNDRSYFDWLVKQPSGGNRANEKLKNKIRQALKEVE